MPDEHLSLIPSLIPWIMAGIGTIVATLATAIAVLFKTVGAQNAAAIEVLKNQNLKQENEMKTLKEHTDRCEEDRIKLFAETAVLTSKLNTLERKIDRSEQ